jgi:hypothetical protein
MRRITAWYQKTGAVIDELEDDERQLLEGIEQAHALMLNRSEGEEWADKKYVVGVLTKQFQISISTAYKYIDLANKLFVTETVAQHAYRRLLLSRMLEQAMEKCVLSNDFKGLEKLGRLYSEINRLDEQVQDERNWQEVLSSKQIILTPNPEALNRAEVLDEEEALAIIKKLEIKSKNKSLGYRDEQ